MFTIRATVPLYVQKARRGPNAWGQLLLCKLHTMIQLQPISCLNPLTLLCPACNVFCCFFFKLPLLDLCKRIIILLIIFYIHWLKQYLYIWVVLFTI